MELAKVCNHSWRAKSSLPSSPTILHFDQTTVILQLKRSQSMMVSSILIAAISLVTVLCYFQFRALRLNIAKAKHSGLPYVVSP
jgi:hypothetical protein